MISNKSAFKMWLPDKQFDSYLQSANNPELLNMKQRIEDEKHSPLRTLIEWFKIISNLKVKEKDQSSSILEEFISFKIILPEAIQMEESAPIPQPQEFWKESSEISDLMIENKCLINPKRLWERPDVIHKSILRSFKKYYLNELDDLTDFKKKFKIANCQDDLLNLANEFISQKISESPYKDLNLFIVALTRPNLEKTLVVDPKLTELSSLVKNVFYGFNKSKMSDLLSYPQFSFMLKKFLSISQLTKFIGEKYSYPHTAEILASQVSFLIERWDEVLATHDPDSVCDQTLNVLLDF